MLSIGKLVAGQQRYYDQQVAHGGDDYYSGRGEAPGQWLGRGAQALGLEGRVSADEFNSLIAGQDPRNPDTRLRSGRDPKVAALDLTFSAPKSVSVLFATAGEPVAREIVDAHESAVRAAVDWLEDNVVQVRRGYEGRRREKGEGLIAAAYRHRMSRALDPQLHTHVVAANMAKGPDKRFTALFGRPLYAAAKTAGYLYQAHLRAEIRDRLGLEWGPVRKGAAELRCVPGSVLEEFSRRRHEMQRAADEGGFSLSSKRSAEAAAIDTRSRKQYGIETHTWREEVQARASEHGLGRSAIEALFPGAINPRGIRSSSDTLSTSPIAPLHATASEMADRLAGPFGLTERVNTFDDRPVLQAFAEAAAQGARVVEVARSSRAFTARHDVVATTHGEWTTADLIACEQRLIYAAVDRASENCAIVDPSTVNRAVEHLERRPTDEQLGAVREITTRGDGVQVIEALAGTGKTFVAGVIRSVYEEAGNRVIGVAPTGRAARELNEEAGIQARTIDRMLIDIEQFGLALPNDSIIVLDEAGMAPTRLTARLLEHARDANAKVIAIGDSGQLPSVLAGGWLRAVGERVGALTLTEVLRQLDPGERRALAALHDGAPRAYLEWADRHGRIRILNRDELHARAIAEWIAAGGGDDPASVVLIARDNDTRDALNAAAREHRAERGQLGSSRTFGSLEVSIGDRIICRHGDGGLDVDNGTRGVVRHADEDRLVLDTDSGLVRELPAEYVLHHVELAYCLTGHGMQGATAERAVVVASPRDLTAGWSYSALSRARGETRLLIATQPPGVRDDRAEVAPAERSLEMNRAKLLVTVSKRMRERDDEDLAIEQLRPARREGDPDLRRTIRGADVLPQEHGAAELDRAIGPEARYAELQTRLEELRTAREALPRQSSRRLDDLDARARDLSAQRATHLDALESMGRFGRRGAHETADPSFLQAAIEIAEQELGTVNDERARLLAELGDPEQVRWELEGVERTIHAVDTELQEIRARLVERELDSTPRWIVDALGHRPQDTRKRAVWDKAARELATYRIEYQVSEQAAGLGSDGCVPAGQRRERARVEEIVTRAQRRLGLAREVGPRDIGIG
jgi:conjugative relaxase-like TrwC/TraI family protein